VVRQPAALEQSDASLPRFAPLFDRIVRPQATPLALFACGVAFCMGLALTFVAGASQHLTALLLRALATGFAVWAWASSPPTPCLWRSPPMLLPALALTVAGFGVLGAPEPGLALTGLAHATAGCLVFFALWRGAPGYAATAWRGLQGMALCHASWALLQACGVGGYRGRSTGGFFNPNDLGAFLVPFVVSAAAESLAAVRGAGGVATAASAVAGGSQPPQGWTLRLGSLVTALGSQAAPLRPSPLQRCMQCLGSFITARRSQAAQAAILLGGVAASGSRAAALACALGLGCLAVPIRNFVSPAQQPRSRGWTILAGALGLAMLGWVGHLRLLHPDPFRYSRLAIWRRCVALAWQHPLGVGMGEFAAALRHFGVPLPGWVHYPYLANHAHNELLQVWVELGLPGLLVATAWVAWLSRQALRCAWQRLQAPLPPGSQVAYALAFGIPACCSNTLHIPPIALAAAVWAAQLAKVSGPKAPEVTATATPQRTRWGPVACLGVIAIAPGVPATVAAVASSQAVRAQHSGNTSLALQRAMVAQQVAPWSLSSALLVLSLQHQRGLPLDATLEALLQLSQRFATDPRPLTRAVTLVQHGGEPGRVLGLGPAEAAHLWEQAAGRDAHNALLWVEAGRAWQAAGEPAAAAHAWQEALAQEPHCVAALGYLAEQAADPEEARLLRKRALRAAAQAHSYRGYAAAVLSAP
jgi:hypothetical protein